MHGRESTGCDSSRSLTNKGVNFNPLYTHKAIFRFYVFLEKCILRYLKLFVPYLLLSGVCLPLCDT